MPSLPHPTPTIVFDTFWRFADERQRIFFKRLNGTHTQWTIDPILQTYKFTNAYRASDRVSQFLIKSVIYSGPQEADELFFRIILFKLFNKIETWKYLEQALGEISLRTYRYSDFDRVLNSAMEAGRSIYSAAYIMASGGTIFQTARKHQAHLMLLEQMIREDVPYRLRDCKTMKHGFEILRSYPMIGNFLAYQLITDINYSTLTNFSEMEFTVPGPGARDGIQKCFSSLGKLSEADLIRMVADRQDSEFSRLGLNFQSLWGRPLQLIDIQNLFCEVDKYSRVKHPDVSGLSGRIRIKQKFRATNTNISYWYPPKWKLSVEQPIRSTAHTSSQPMLL